MRPMPFRSPQIGRGTARPYFTRVPAAIVSPTVTTVRFGDSPAASSIPCEVIPRSGRGARFATTTMRFPTRAAGSGYACAMPVGGQKFPALRWWHGNHPVKTAAIGCERVDPLVCLGCQGSAAEGDPPDCILQRILDLYRVSGLGGGVFPTQRPTIRGLAEIRDPQ